MDLPPVGERRLAGHREGHERIPAKPELAPLAVHRQPLLPALCAGRLDEQVQAVPVEVAPGRRDCLHTFRRQGMVQAPAAALWFMRHVSHRSDPPGPRIVFVHLQGHPSEPDSTGQYNPVPESVSGTKRLFYRGKAGGSA